MILEAALVLALIILLWGFARTPAPPDEQTAEPAAPLVIRIRPGRDRRQPVPISVYRDDPALTAH